MNDMFEVDNEAVKLLVELAKEGAEFDPIDWGDLNITEDQAYVMMAAHVLEMPLNEDLTARAIIVKLLVENFVLNLRLLGKE
jgi:hypothetical protein